MSGIEEMDKELGTVERDSMEPQSWHGEENVREDMTLDHCQFAQTQVRASEVQHVIDGEVVESEESASPVIWNPVREKWMSIGSTFNPKTYRLFLVAEIIAFIRACFQAAGLNDSISFTTTLFSGRRWTVSKAAGNYKDHRGNEIRGYLNFLGSWDKSWSLFVNHSSIRTVCFNTATANLLMGGCHCKFTPEGIARFVQSFPAIFADALKSGEEMANQYLIMADINFTLSETKAFFAQLLAKDGKLSVTAYNAIEDHLSALFKYGKGCYGENAADVYNAATEYYTHEYDAEANATGGTADTMKRSALVHLIGPNLPERIDKGKEILSKFEQERAAR